jgi:hypothetical protein
MNSLTSQDQENHKDGRRPIEEVLPGMQIHPLDPGWTPLEAFVLIKSLDESGDTAWAYRATHRPNREELLGDLIVQTDILRKELVEGWESA